jgi:NADPH2:quinone reductase
MKAAVLHRYGEAPRYEEFAKPEAGPGEVAVRVKAVAVENVDLAMAKGTHFASREFLPELPGIVGFDGIGALEDGRRVGFGGTRPPYGALAEWTVVPAAYTVPIPDDVDDVTAAALPASAMTSLFPLKWGAKLQPGETVWIQGATGVSGKLAVQVAKLLGAGRVVGTGRNEASLRRVLELGADAVIDLKQPDEALRDSFRKEAENGCDVVLDFLWGRPTEALLAALTPERLTRERRRTRLVQIGEMAGARLTLPADALRTSGLEISGAAAGMTAESMGEGTEMVWTWLREKKLSMDIETVPLERIEAVWNRGDFQGKRLVIVP